MSLIVTSGLAFAFSGSHDNSMIRQQSTLTTRYNRLTVFLRILLSPSFVKSIPLLSKCNQYYEQYNEDQPARNGEHPPFEASFILVIVIGG